MQILLSESECMGDYVFNKKDMKVQQIKPADQWIRVLIYPIIYRQVFTAVAAKRHKKSPAVTLEWVVTNPTLFTGLLRC